MIVHALVLAVSLLAPMDVPTEDTIELRVWAGAEWRTTMTDDPSMDWEWQKRTEEDYDIRADERRKVGRQILNPNKLKGRGLHLRADEMGGPIESMITEGRVRRICGLEDEDE